MRTYSLGTKVSLLARFHGIILTLCAQQAKSEDQLVAEKEWLSSQRVWLVHKAGFAAAQLLDTPEIAEGKVKVKVEHSGEVLEVDEEDIEKVGGDDK